jgi:hypothetical protein
MKTTGCRRAVFVAALVLLAACAALVARPRSGRPALPDFEAGLGPVQLVGITTTIHLCPRLMNPDCYFLERPPQRYVYTIWLIRRHRGDERQPADVRRVLSVMLDDRVDTP